MILKVFKAVWFLSLMVLFGVFFYDYASLPESVTVHQEGITRVEMSRDGVFYGVIILITLANASVFLVSRFFSQTNIDFATWFYGLIIIFNGFFVIAMSYLSLFNSGENFEYNRLGVIIYGSVTLILLWLASWPVIAAVKKFRSKPAI